jgi:three-Cys-motif partner protein
MAQDWSLPPHTEAKHKILRYYLGAWFAIMAEGSPERRFVFLDGFAGRGRYNDGQPGSPLIALEVLLDHPLFERWSQKDFTFIFVEPDNGNFDNLCAELEGFWSDRGGQPSNVRVLTLPQTFEDAAEGILESLGGKSLAPTFAFVDPFGWKGLPLDVISRLLAYDKCEVFVNFMIDHVNRFVEVGDVQSSIQELFGTTAEHLPPEDVRGDDRRDFLIELYGSQLKQRAGFKYVVDFQMIDMRGRPLYHLFYGTRSLTGLDRMKQAMWKVDPGGGVRFSDRVAGSLVLFGDSLDPAPLKLALIEKFKGKTVAVEEIRDYVIAETPYASNHFNRPVLNPMEKEGLIRVVASSREKRFTFPAGTRIQFV